jgi:hypothetical protein
VWRCGALYGNIYGTVRSDCGWGEGGLSRAWLKLLQSLRLLKMYHNVSTSNTALEQNMICQVERTLLLRIYLVSLFHISKSTSKPPWRSGNASHLYYQSLQCEVSEECVILNRDIAHHVIYRIPSSILGGGSSFCFSSFFCRFW